MIFRLLNLELENDEKIYVDGFVFSAIAIYRGHISPPVWRMCPIPNFPLIRENIIIFSNKTFKVLVFENENQHITDSKFW